MAPRPEHMATTATSRLRKAFRYPSEDDSDHDLSDLDEEHQEQLIASLQREDARKNDLYRRLFLTIPLVAAAFFLYTLLVAALTAQQRLVSVLSLSSLGCTAYILHFLPIRAPARKGKMAEYKVEAAKGPVEKYLAWLNAGLAGLLQIAAVVSWGRGEVEEAWRRSFGLIIFALTMIVRLQLRPMDLEELERAKYDLKGA